MSDDNIESKLENFENAFKVMIQKLRHDPRSYGPLSVRSILTLKEQVSFLFISHKI